MAELPCEQPKDPESITSYILQTSAVNSNVPIVPNGMGHMDWVRDSWHQSRIVPPRRDLRRLASVQAVTRLSRLYLPGGTIPFFPLPTRPLRARAKPRSARGERGRARRRATSRRAS